MTRRLLVLAAAVLAGLPAVPSAAQESGEQPAASLQLASQTPWVAPDGNFGMRVRVELEGRRVRAGDAADLELRVSVHDRVRSRSAFQLTTQDQALPATLQTVAVALGDVAPDAGGAVPVSFPVRDGAEPDDPAALRLREAGVYPVRVELRDATGGLATLVTHLVRVPPTGDDAVPLDVGLVLPVGAEPARRPDGSVTLDPPVMRDLSTTVEALEEHRGVAASIVPTPETVDALGVTAADGGGAGDDVLRSLRRSVLGRQLLGGPYVRVDVTAFVLANLGGELAAQFTRGADAIARRLRTRPDGRTYVADELVTPAALSRLRELGIDQVVMPEASLEPVELPTTLTRPFELEVTGGRRMAAVAADTGLSGHFAAEDPVLGAHRLLADLAVLFFDRPGRDQRGVVVVPPVTWDPSPAFLDTLLTGLGRASLLEPVTIDGLFRDVPVELLDEQPLVRQLRPAPAGDGLGASADAIRLTRLRLSGYDAMTEADNPRFALWEQGLLVSQGADLDASARRDQLDAVNTAIDGEVAAIRVPERQTVTLTSREADVPLSFRNEAGYPVRVRIRLESDKLEFPDGDTVDVTFAEANTTATFHVRARTSGAFPLRVHVSAPDCCLDVANTRFTVRSTAVSGVAAFLSIGAGAFLLVWWLLHFRKVRRDRRLVGRSQPAGHHA